MATSCARTQHICLGIIVCARTQHSSGLLARLQLSVTRRRRWCRRAAVLDLKMGTHTYAPDATAEKIARRLRKDARTGTTLSHGLNVVGARYPVVWGGVTGRGEGRGGRLGPTVNNSTVNKELGGAGQAPVEAGSGSTAGAAVEPAGMPMRTVGDKLGQCVRTEAELLEALRGFFCPPCADGVLAGRQLLRQALEAVKDITAWFEHQTEYGFYASSLLFVYDADDSSAPLRCQVHAHDRCCGLGGDCARWRGGG
jgi:hypothetical protein